MTGKGQRDETKVVDIRQNMSKRSKRVTNSTKSKSADSPSADMGSRQAILEAAARIMATKGFSGASISMICKAAGCPASSLYWHFSSKENLFAEVVHWKADFFFGQFRANENDKPLPEGSIEDLAEQVGRSLQDDPLFLRFLLLLGLERKDMPEEVRDVIFEVRNSARLWWQSLLERQFSNLGPTVAKLVAEEYAEFGRSLIDGAFFAWDFGDGPDLRKVFRQFIALLAALNEKIAAEKKAGSAGASYTGSSS